MKPKNSSSSSKPKGVSYSTISMPSPVMAAAKERATVLGLKFSQYVTQLIRKDQQAGSTSFIINESAPDQPSSSPVRRRK
jgi:hypothetical protein